MVAATSAADALQSLGAPSSTTFINGSFQPGGGESIDLVYPGDGRSVGSTHATSVDAVSSAIEGASQAASRWALADSHARASVLARAAERLRRERDRFAQAIVLDAGKTWTEARREVGAAAALLRQAAALAPHLEGSTYPIDRGMVRFTWREPFGVIGAIVPFNAPLLFSALKIGPALASGNVVVLKAPEQTPLSPAMLAEAFAESNLPTGVLQVVVGGADIGGMVVEDPRVSLVTLTGGTETGRRVMAAAASSGPKPVLLELGGKSANIVFDDADLESAVAGAMAGIFSDAGQRCFSGSRLLIHEAVADRFLEMLSDSMSRLVVGDPLQGNPHVGPVIGPEVVERIAAAEADAAAGGAELVRSSAPLPADGAYVLPSLIVDPPVSAMAWTDELFAPVAVVKRFSDDDEAVALANDSEFGLAGGCWTTSLERALRTARHVTTGYFWVNAYSALTFEAPFGGTKHSGIGSEFGRRGIEAYTREKTVLIDLAGGQVARVFEVE